LEIRWIVIEGNCRFNCRYGHPSRGRIAEFRPAWFESRFSQHAHCGPGGSRGSASVPIANGEMSDESSQRNNNVRSCSIRGGGRIYQPEPLNIGGLFATRKDRDMGSTIRDASPRTARRAWCSAPGVCKGTHHPPTFFITKSRRNSTSLGRRDRDPNPVEVVDGDTSEFRSARVGSVFNMKRI